MKWGRKYMRSTDGKPGFLFCLCFGYPENLYNSFSVELLPLMVLGNWIRDCLRPWSLPSRVDCLQQEGSQVMVSGLVWNVWRLGGADRGRTELNNCPHQHQVRWTQEWTDCLHSMTAPFSLKQSQSTTNICWSENIFLMFIFISFKPSGILKWASQVSVHAMEGRVSRRTPLGAI